MGLFRNSSEISNKKIVLLIEDSSADAVLFKTYLHQKWPDLEILHAANMKEAYEFYKSSPYNFIIMDVNLPDGLGYSSLSEVRKYNFDIPMLVTSGMNPQLSLHKEQKSHLFYYYSKDDILRGKADVLLSDMNS